MQTERLKIIGKQIADRIQKSLPEYCVIQCSTPPLEWRVFKKDQYCGGFCYSIPESVWMRLDVPPDQSSNSSMLSCPADLRNEVKKAISAAIWEYLENQRGVA